MNSGNCRASGCYAARRIDAITGEYYKEIAKYCTAYDKIDDFHTKALYAAIIAEKTRCIKQFSNLKTDILLNQVI